MNKGTLIEKLLSEKDKLENRIEAEHVKFNKRTEHLRRDLHVIVSALSMYSPASQDTPDAGVSGAGELLTSVDTLPQSEPVDLPNFVREKFKS